MEDLVFEIKVYWQLISKLYRYIILMIRFSTFEMISKTPRRTRGHYQKAIETCPERSPLHWAIRQDLNKEQIIKMKGVDDVWFEKSFRWDSQI